MQQMNRNLKKKKKGLILKLYIFHIPRNKHLFFFFFSFSLSIAVDWLISTCNFHHSHFFSIAQPNQIITTINRTIFLSLFFARRHSLNKHGWASLYGRLHFLRLGSSKPWSSQRRHVFRYTTFFFLSLLSFFHCCLSMMFFFFSSPWFKKFQFLV